MDRRGRHRETLCEFAKRNVESFFIAMEVPVIKIRLLVEPHGQRERAPGPFLVDHNLTAFKFGA